VTPPFPVPFIAGRSASTFQLSVATS